MGIKILNASQVHFPVGPLQSKRSKPASYSVDSNSYKGLEKHVKACFWLLEEERDRKYPVRSESCAVRFMIDLLTTEQCRSLRNDIQRNEQLCLKKKNIFLFI